MNDKELSLSTDNLPDFLEALVAATDREVLDYIALNIFQLRQQTQALLPAIQKMASGPMGAMLGGLFG